MRLFNMVMSNKSVYRLSENEANSLLKSQSNWIVLKEGSIINKAFIVEIKLDKEATANLVNKEVRDQYFDSLPPPMDISLLKSMKSQIVKQLAIKAKSGT